MGLHAGYCLPKIFRMKIRFGADIDISACPPHFKPQIHTFGTSKFQTLNNLTSSKFQTPGGGLGIFTNRDQQSIFLGFEFQKFVFFCTQLTAAVFFGLLDKCCIFKCFISVSVLFWLKFYVPGTSVITVLHCYHIVLNFCQMNSVLEGFAFAKYFFECSVSGKAFFG